MTPRDAVTAVRRFGLGARPGEITRAASDPRGWLQAQLANPKKALLDDAGLLSSADLQALVVQAQKEMTAARLAAQSKAAATPAGMPTMPVPLAAAQPPPSAPAAPPMAPSTQPGGFVLSGYQSRVYQAEMASRISRARETETPLLERLVMFWSNHFCVADKPATRAALGSYEREAIRPHVLGNFSDMLLAVEQHPAMLAYLDNVNSVGPQSEFGVKRKRGLNENLAREILELHTLSVDGGYTQDDVTNLSRLLTGWTGQGTFRFDPAVHEPGVWTVVGKTYRSGGVDAGRNCLLDLARHPATARHVCGKFAAHFTGDTPPPALVAQLETVFRRTDGDLAALTRTLVQSDEAWSHPPTKGLPAYDFAIAIARGFGWGEKPDDVSRFAMRLGQPLWRAGSPKGYPQGDDSWVGPSAVRDRLRLVEAMVARFDPALDPRRAAEELLGADLRPATRQAIARAETRAQGLVLLIMSPDFQRR